MAAKGRENLKSSSSLLLQPPKSGFSWDPTSSSAFLMPITQSEASVIPEDTGEADSFVNQTPPTTDFQYAVDSSPPQVTDHPPFVNQLQQPLRPLQSISPVSSIDVAFDQPIITPGCQSLPPPSVPHSVTSTVAPSVPSTQYFTPPCPIPSATSPLVTYDGPPNKGPSQNFRRQGPRVYAPPPGMTSMPSAPLDQPPVYLDQQSVSMGNLDQQPISIQSSPLPSFQSQSQNYAMFPSPASQIPAPPSAASPYYSGMSENQYTHFQPPTQHSFDNIYKPIQPHWFYVKVIEKNDVWLPFSMLDSVSLEEAFRADPEHAVVATDGGRYDVYLDQRVRKAVYWEEEPSTVRRCTWFYRADGQNRFVPYHEDFASKLEEHYKASVLNNSWHQRLELPNSETVVMHNSNVVLHFMASSHPDEWGNVAEGQTRPRSLKRGISDFVNIEDGEPTKIDHLVFVVHGVGAVCDMRFRTVVECVDDIRSMALGLLQTHFKTHSDEGRIGRVEFLPVSWHSMLHSEATGIDRRLKHITLTSIPKLRHFINDTILDIPFYCSPVYCQTIVSAVGSELNRLYDLFLSRNPNFTANISVVGHSLGSLILFDILAHQQQPKSELFQEEMPTQLQRDSPHHSYGSERSTPDKITEEDKNETTIITLFEKLGLQEYVHKFEEEKIDLETLKICTENDIKELGLPKGPRLKLMTALRELDQQQKKNQDISSDLQTLPPVDIPPIQTVPFKLDGTVSTVYAMGVAGSGQPPNFPILKFQPSIFFALGSPIAMFLTVRGIDTIGEDYRLPSCPAFYNIFHPFDPVAYRMETLIDPTLNLKPVLVPHHKGRKRMHLEIRESLSRLGADLKHRILEPIFSTWNTINDFARAHRSTSDIQEDLRNIQQDCDDTESTVSEVNVDDIQIGQLNGGQRIDYVLQEKPLESLNEYLFALGSHASYWESDDTVLMIIKKIYALLDIFPVHRGPQATRQVPLYNPALAHPSQFTDMSPSAVSASSSTGQLPQVGISPTQPSIDPPITSAHSFPVQSQGQPIGPPPLTGFVKTSPLVRR